ncbi:MAG: hypothetical protein GY847_32970, partial [Proteobacteria bacterium]|nr:hypothetical protein [Pseudomonadota bacterium]
MKARFSSTPDHVAILHHSYAENDNFNPLLMQENQLLNSDKKSEFVGKYSKAIIFSMGIVGMVHLSILIWLISQDPNVDGILTGAPVHSCATVI